MKTITLTDEQAENIKTLCYIQHVKMLREIERWKEKPGKVAMFKECAEACAEVVKQL